MLNVFKLRARSINVFKLRTVIRSQFYFKIVLLYIEPFVKEVVQLDMNNLHVSTKDEAKKAKLKTIIKS